MRLPICEPSGSPMAISAMPITAGAWCTACGHIFFLGGGGEHTVSMLQGRSNVQPWLRVQYPSLPEHGA
jgi:hypothetical protein